MRLCEEKGLWLHGAAGPADQCRADRLRLPRMGAHDAGGAGAERRAADSTSMPPGACIPPPVPGAVLRQRAFFDGDVGLVRRDLPDHRPPSGARRVHRDRAERQRDLLPLPRSDLCHRLQRPIRWRSTDRFWQTDTARYRPLNGEYRTAYRAFSATSSRRAIAGSTGGPICRCHLDWVAYKEYQIRWAVARFAAHAAGAGDYRGSDLPRRRLSAHNPARCRPDGSRARNRLGRHEHATATRRSTRRSPAGSVFWPALRSCRSCRNSAAGSGVTTRRPSSPRSTSSSPSAR